MPPYLPHFAWTQDFFRTKNDPFTKNYKKNFLGRAQHTAQAPPQWEGDTPRRLLCLEPHTFGAAFPSSSQNPKYATEYETLLVIMVN